MEEIEKYKCKNDEDKPRLDLVPPAIVEAVGIVRMYGTEKYGDPENWRNVEKERFKAALMRHLCKFLRDEYGVDEESGLPHLWHMACNIAFLCEIMLLEKPEYEVSRFILPWRKKRQKDAQSTTDTF